MVAHRGHCPKILFESEPAPISRDGQVSLSRLAHYQDIVGAEPTPATKGLFAPSKYANTARGWIFSLNYHRRVLKLALQWIYLGMWLSHLKAVYK